MRIKDVPQHLAYLVFHDAYDNGAMDVYGMTSLEAATDEALYRNRQLEAIGMEEGGGWKAYEKLPRVKVFKYHGNYTR